MFFLLSKIFLGKALYVVAASRRTTGICALAAQNTPLAQRLYFTLFLLPCQQQSRPGHGSLGRF
jgi:hypothetical protein